MVLHRVLSLLRGSLVLVATLAGLLRGERPSPSSGGLAPPPPQSPPVVPGPGGRPPPPHLQPHTGCWPSTSTNTSAAATTTTTVLRGEWGTVWDDIPPPRGGTPPPPPLYHQKKKCHLRGSHHRRNRRADLPSIVRTTQLLHRVLQDTANSTIEEVLIPIDREWQIDPDCCSGGGCGGCNGCFRHLRYQPYLRGYPVEGAIVVVRVNSDGVLYQIEGDLHPAHSVVLEIPHLECEMAAEAALREHQRAIALGSAFDSATTTSAAYYGQWESPCQMAAVQGRDGRPHVAYKRLWGYRTITTTTTTDDDNNNNNDDAVTGGGDGGGDGSGSTFHVDAVFASPRTGALVAVHNQFLSHHTTFALNTYDCHNNTSDHCTRVHVNHPVYWRRSTRNGAVVVDDAHNHVLRAYTFFLRIFHRDSVDGHGAPLTVKVRHHPGNRTHEECWYDNNSESGPTLWVGNNDAATKTQDQRPPAFDMVVRAFAHGITSFTSKLLDKGHSGAIKESFSDIMGATADRLVLGKNESEVWSVGEDMAHGNWYDNDKGIRKMDDPDQFRDPNHISQYFWASSKDEIIARHKNCAIMNYAFYLLVNGGTHPQSGITVPALSPDFTTSIREAALIFYEANVDCMQATSNFWGARYCTVQNAGENAEAVGEAWDAVGIGKNVLFPGQLQTGLQQPLVGDTLWYTLGVMVEAGSSLACQLSGNNGDADLYVELDSTTDPSRIWWCQSERGGTSNERCSVGPVSHNCNAFIKITAHVPFDGAALLCSIVDA